MKLHDIIAGKIKQKNIISFAEFMQLALYHSKYGYYRSNFQKFGVGGDFITAPETSDLFGFTIAKQIAEVEGDILEFGAGSGVMAAQILLQLAKDNKLPNKYYILELSASLKSLQQKNIFAVLPELKDKIEWLNQLPDNFNGSIIGNEMLDAIPTKRIIYNKNEWFELGVSIKNENFIWQKMLPFKIDFAGTFVNNYTSEFNQQALAWIDSIYKIMSSGVVLLIDYGFTEREFYQADRIDGTLRCYKNHKASNNPFVNIGKQDITSWVNFSAIKNQAQLSGFETIGYATQSMFLLSLGIDKFLLEESDDKKRIQLTNELKQLVMPNAMGESFKVLALSKNYPKKLQGFNEQNLLKSL